MIFFCLARGFCCLFLVVELLLSTNKFSTFIHDKFFLNVFYCQLKYLLYLFFISQNKLLSTFFSAYETSNLYLLSNAQR